MGFNGCRDDYIGARRRKTAGAIAKIFEQVGAFAPNSSLISCILID